MFYRGRVALMVALTVVCSMSLAQDAEQQGEHSALSVAEGSAEILPGTANVASVLVDEVEGGSASVTVRWFITAC